MLFSTHHRTSLVVLAGVMLLAACSRNNDAAAPAAAASNASAPVAAASAQVQSIAWKHASNDADVDAAFAQAKAENKPVFLYWGANWCPPCNQVKATLFNRQDFIERSRAFVPVYVDGDQPGAQKIGARFKVGGYPTMVLFNPAGAELTRMPGEVDAQQYTQVLTLGMSAQRPLKEVLADARNGGKGLSPNEWKLLAFYSWDTDEQQALPKSELPAVLKQLAAAAPSSEADTSTRLFLKSWAAAGSKLDPKAVVISDDTARERLLGVLRSAEPSRSQMDVLSYNAVELVRALSSTGTPQRAQLLEAYDASLAGLANDVTLSRTDRVTALVARVQLARVDQPKDAKPSVASPVPPSLLADVREQVARIDRETTDRYERQTVITTAAYLLSEAGAAEDSDTLLKAELDKSHSPYYLMSALASNAKKRGDKIEALRWYEEAFNKSEGPATRLQWGSAYVRALLELAPQDASRIERAASQLFKEAGEQPDVFYERNARALQRAGQQLAAWQKQKGPGRAETIKRLQAQLDGVCGKLPDGDAQRDVCRGLLKRNAQPAAT